MAIGHGKVYFVNQSKIRRGVWIDDDIIERDYSYQLLSNNKRFENGIGLNDDITISNRISIIADAFANQNYFNIKYVEYNGAKWKVSSVEINAPRLILTLGGIYNDWTEA